MNVFDALNLIALKGVVDPDSESNLRFVMRWYSKTFHTPLHQVQHEVPVEDVWLAFFEERYSGMTRAELQEHIDLALETPEERAARIAQEEAEKASEAAFTKMTEEKAKAPEKKPDFLSQVPKLIETQPEPAPVVEPDINIEFVSDSEMEKLLAEGDGASKTKEPDPLSFR